MKRMLVAPAAATFVLITVSACGAMVVEEADVEKGVSDVLTEEVGTAPDKVECPGDLEAEKGKTMRCTLTAGEDELGLTVTVTEVDGSDVNYDVEVDAE